MKLGETEVLVLTMSSAYEVLNAERSFQAGGGSLLEAAN